MPYNLTIDEQGNASVGIQRDSAFIKTDVLIDSEGRVHFDLWVPPFAYTPKKGDRIHTVTSADAGRPDLIAYAYYKNVALYWLICDYNKILHPLNELTPGRKLIIPDPKYVSSYLSSSGVR
jgi:hypothetical protein